MRMAAEDNPGATPVQCSPSVLPEEEVFVFIFHAAIAASRGLFLLRRVQRIGNWLTGDQAQALLNAISQRTLRGRRDAAMIGLLLGCGLRRSETVNLRLDQLQSRQNHRVIVDMIKKGGRLRTVPVPVWCKCLIDA